MNSEIKRLNIDRDTIIKNVRLCVQPKTDDEIMKRNYLDLEIYLRVDLGDGLSFKIPERFPVSELELWDIARHNTRRNVEVQDLGAFLGVDEDGTVKIVSNKSKMFGASAILFDDVFRELCFKNRWSGCMIVPSSIHELLVLSSDFCDSESMNMLINTVNQNEVAENERLSNHFYSYSVAENTITYERSVA